MAENLPISPLGDPDGSSFTPELNNKLDAISEQFDKVLYKDGTEDMTGDLNANGQHIYNLPAPVYDHEPIRLADLPSLLKGEKGDPGSAGEGYSTRPSLATAGNTATNLDDAYLTETKRKGKFTFDSSNRSADVTADPQQGLFVAKASAPTGSSGIWVRDFTVPTVEMFGATKSLDGTLPADSAAAINSAIDTVVSRGGKQLHIPPGLYTANGHINLKSGIHLIGRGSEIRGSNTTLWVSTPMSDITLEGITIRETSGLDNIPGFTFREQINGLTMLECEFERVITAGGYAGVIYSADDVKIDGLICKGTNGIWAMGRRWNVTNWKMIAKNGTGGDDCWAIKGCNPVLDAGSIGTSTSDMTFSNGYAEGYAGVICVGSEIGEFNSYVNPVGTRSAKRITADNIIGKNNSRFLFIKPGINVGNICMNGLVQDVRMDNCISEGQVDVFAEIACARGSVVDDVRLGKNNKFRGRAVTTQDLQGGIAIHTLKMGEVGEQPGVIKNIKVNVDMTDAYNGDPTSGAAPDKPFHYGVFMEQGVAGWGTISDVHLEEVRVNGVKRTPIYIGAGITGTTIGDAVIKNYNNTSAAPSSDAGTIYTGSPVRLKGDLIAVPSTNASATVRGVMPDGQADKTMIVANKVEQVKVPTWVATPAGVVVATPLFVADRDLWISKIELLTSTAPGQNDTNYWEMYLRNGGTGNFLVGINNKVTGGANILADTLYSLGGSNAFSGANSILPKGAYLRLEMRNYGTTGSSLVNPLFRIHYVPYGAA